MYYLLSKAFKYSEINDTIKWILNLGGGEKMGMKRMTLYCLALLTVLTLVITSFSSFTSSANSAEVVKDAPETALVEIVLPDVSMLDNLVESGYELTGYVSDGNGQLEVHAIITEEDAELLESQGYEVTTLQTAQDVKQILRQQESGSERRLELSSEGDNINVFRADYFTNYSGTFLYLEAKSSAGRDVDMNAQWVDANGEQQSVPMRSKVDAGAYLYHFVLTKIDSVPENVVITTNQNGRIETPLNEWVEDGTPVGDDYLMDFVDEYMNPTEITDRIEALASEFPELAEIIELPNETNGYRRNAQATFGSIVDAAFVLTSEAWGHEGGNDITVDILGSDEANSELEVTVDGDQITINLATDDSGDAVSTASEVIDAINESVGDSVTATLYRNSSGNGIVQAEENVSLSDNLSAPEEISRDPQTVKAIRIGKSRDGSKPGVLGYSQEHAREWVTPLVSVETAERLLRNYYTDENTRELVDNLDIFIVPSVNPDGGHYSFFDYNSQRKNMTNHCDAATADPGYRNSWGVDLNRNYDVGSVYNGYIGGSTNCLSGTYAGPEPYSEPEAQNLVWLAEQNTNIKFAMNVHAYGGYFMWSPGAYDQDRNPLPVPTAGEEAYYWQASEHILSEIKDYRDTVILPGRTGPIPDVLYSAGGNSADELWYNHDIYAWNFEVGADIWDEARERWVGVGFQPEFEEGHAEAMEFSNGLIGMFEVALENANDETNPETTINPEEGTYHEPVEVEFEMSEPATVYYTLDGSRPNLESDVILVGGTRELSEKLMIDETTTIKWFSVDTAENIENDYNPDNADDNNYNEARIVIDYLPEGVSAAGIKSLVERFEDEGEFESATIARGLKNHLTAVDLFEKQQDADKVLKHMNSFILMLDQHNKNELISGKAYRILSSYANELIDLWTTDFDSEQAMTHIEYLSVDIGPRVAGTDAEREAAVYIKNEFESLGYEVSTQEFDIRGNNKSRNVIAVKSPVGIENPEIIYVTAHYDSVPGSPGANDDATGTAAILELARNMNNVSTDKEIRFIAFGAEEIGLVGSRYYVDQLSDSEIDRSIINFQLEMLGSIWEPSSKLLVNTVDGNPNLVWEYTKAASETLGVNDSVVLFRRGSSDHVPFHNVGIDAAALNMGPESGGLEPWYHTPEDTFDKISPERVQFSGDILNAAISAIFEQEMALEDAS